MKIAIYHNLPGGGSVRVLENQYHTLVKNGHHVDVFSVSEKNPQVWKHILLSKVREQEIYIRPWKGFLLRNLWILIMLPKAHQQLAQTIDSNQYDAVVINHDYFTKAPYLLKYLKTKTIYILHEPPREFYEDQQIVSPTLKDRIVNIFRRYIKSIDHTNTKSATIIVANSKYSQKIIKHIYKRSSKLAYPTVDANRFKYSGPKKDFLLLIGGLNRIKGHLFVLNALATTSRPYRIIVIGGGSKSEIEEILKLNKTTNMQIKIISKHVSDSILIRMYGQASALCIGAYNEPLGLTSLEAQSCSTPVVTVNEGGVPETIINGKTGLCVKRDYRSYAHAVDKLMKNSTRFGKEAREHIIKNWAEKDTTGTLESIILNTIK